MKQFFSCVQKEFRHIMRDRQTLLILLGMPVALIMIFGFALTTEVKNSKFAVLDFSKDVSTRAIVNELEASRYFDQVAELHTHRDVEKVFHTGKAKVVVVFSSSFASDLQHVNKATVQIIADASDPNVATTLAGYATTIIMDYLDRYKEGRKLPYTIKTQVRMLYNPQLKGTYNFVPGVISMVLMLVCTMMTAITVVREKETGTMEVLLVSPVPPIKLIIAKAVPYALISFVNIISILLLSVFVLDVPIQGSLALLLAESILFTLTCLSFGLLISTTTNSQQMAMFFSLIGLFLPTLMLSGFLFPIENMPTILQVISHIVPARWFYQIVRAVMIQGLPFTAVWKETLILGGMTVILLGAALKNFKIRLA
ncbi:MAG TPA: ABC transporter permease [Flavisolibacter sp.]|nr:ABC transporter permease [Flavisolibacter sp.]